MTMITIERPSALVRYIGNSFGPSDWLLITQDMIDLFARATGDFQWIHCDPARAKREMPGGTTIAHGFLTLSLLMPLQNTLYTVQNTRHGLNYGINKLRFVSPVPTGSRVRLSQTIKSAELVEGGGVRVVTESVFEVEGASKPALAAETIGLFFE
jgi:acyl dehydratase